MHRDLGSSLLHRELYRPASAQPHSIQNDLRIPRGPLPGWLRLHVCGSSVRGTPWRYFAAGKLERSANGLCQSFCWSYSDARDPSGARRWAAQHMNTIRVAQPNLSTRCNISAFTPAHELFSSSLTWTLDTWTQSTVAKAVSSCYQLVLMLDVAIGTCLNCSGWTI